MDADEVLVRLVAEWGDQLLRFAFQLTHESAAAEDVVQEALVGIYRHLSRSANAPANVHGYARRAVLNEFLRRRRLRSASEVVTAAVPEQASTFDGAIVERAALWQALAELPDRQRAVLVLRFYEDLADRDIADLLGVQESSVRSLALRALRAVRASACVVGGDI